MGVRKTIEVIVYSNLWISFGSACFAWLFYLLSELTHDLKVLGFIFFSTLLTYTFQRFMKLRNKEKINGRRMYWMQKNRRFVNGLLFFGATGTVFFSFYLTLLSLVVLSLLALISFFYAYKFSLWTRRTNLRDLPGIKIFLIGIVWTLTCTVIPSIELGERIFGHLSTYAGFFLFIIGVTIPFDIRDIDYDEISKRTIPQLIGENRAKGVAGVLLILSFFAMSYPFYSLWELGVGIVISLLLVFGSDKGNNELYFSFFVDGLFLFVPCCYYLLKSL